MSRRIRTGRLGDAGVFARRARREVVVGYLGGSLASAVNVAEVGARLVDLGLSRTEVQTVHRSHVAWTSCLLTENWP